MMSGNLQQGMRGNGGRLSVAGPERGEGESVAGWREAEVRGLGW